VAWRHSSARELVDSSSRLGSWRFQQLHQQVGNRRGLGRLPELMRISPEPYLTVAGACLIIYWHELKYRPQTMPAASFGPHVGVFQNIMFFILIFILFSTTTPSAHDTPASAHRTPLACKCEPGVGFCLPASKIPPLPLPLPTSGPPPTTRQKQQPHQHQQVRGRQRQRRTGGLETQVCLEPQVLFFYLTFFVSTNDKHNARPRGDG
jgi:hypothetical protein